MTTTTTVYLTAIIYCIKQLKSTLPPPWTAIMEHKHKNCRGSQGILGVGISVDQFATNQLVGNAEGVASWPPESIVGIPIAVTSNSTRREFADENPMAVAKILAGWLRAVSFINNKSNKEEVLDYMSAFFWSKQGVYSSIFLGTRPCIGRLVWPGAATEFDGTTWHRTALQLRHYLDKWSGRIYAE